MKYSKINTDEAKERIANAFIDLLESNSYSKISIKMICETTPISRNAFYYHFSGKEELVKWIVIKQFMKYCLPYFKFKENDIGTKMFFTYIYEQKDFYNAIYRVDNGELLRKSLLEAYKIGMSPENIKEYTNIVRRNKIRIDERICAAYINSAIAGVVLFWIEDGMKMSIDYVARDMTLLLTKSMEDIKDYHLY